MAQNYSSTNLLQLTLLHKIRKIPSLYVIRKYPKFVCKLGPSDQLLLILKGLCKYWTQKLNRFLKLGLKCWQYRTKMSFLYFPQMRRTDHQLIWAIKKQDPAEYVAFGSESLSFVSQVIDFWGTGSAVTDFLLYI